MHNNARIFLVFFIAAIVGTLAHECGHAFVGEMVGFKTSVHYSYTSCEDCLELNHAATTRELLEVYWQKSTLMTLGGPAQTILTGIIGVIALLRIRRKEVLDAYNRKHLIWLVLAFFWSRCVFNEVFFWTKYIARKELAYRCDECKLFAYYNVPPLYGHLVILAIGCAILAWVTFGLLQKHRLQFIIWGGLGSFSGGLLWLYVLGEYVMP